MLLRPAPALMSWRRIRPRPVPVRPWWTWLHEIDQAINAVNLTHQQHLAAVRQAAERGAERRRAARVIWEDYRQYTRPLYDQLSQTIDDLEDTTGRALGMAQAAIDAGQAFREATATYWRANDALWRNFFDQVDTKRLPGRAGRPLPADEGRATQSYWRLDGAA